MEALNKFLKSVSDKSLCDWFFSMYVLTLVLASFQVIHLVLTVSGLFYMKGTGPKVAASVAIITSLILLGIAVFNSLFLYSLCNRSLLRDKSGA